MAFLGLLVTSCTSATRSCDAPPTSVAAIGSAGYALLFCGTGANDIDRVKIQIDEPRNEAAGPAVDVGATDFTIEWWMRATREGNNRRRIACGDNINWINGNIILDRDRFNQGRKFGVSLGGGRVVFGVSGVGEDHLTICGTTNVADGQWHHVAIQRRRLDGRMDLFVDGVLEARATGPMGDISYPDDGVPRDFCGGPCVNSDPYLVIGAEKHDAGPAWPGYTGWIDEVRVSTILRYEEDFPRPSSPFAPDIDTAALWHFDEGGGTVLVDSSRNGSDGVIRVGGPHSAPRWGASDAPIG